MLFLSFDASNLPQLLGACGGGSGWAVPNYSSAIPRRSTRTNTSHSKSILVGAFLSARPFRAGFCFILFRFVTSSLQSFVPFPRCAAAWRTNGPDRMSFVAPCTGSSTRASQSAAAVMRNLRQPTDENEGDRVPVRQNLAGWLHGYSILPLLQSAPPGHSALPPRALRMLGYFWLSTTNDPIPVLVGPKPRGDQGAFAARSTRLLYHPGRLSTVGTRIRYRISTGTR